MSTNEPGVSGKEENGKSWVNSDELSTQNKFVKGSKEIGRSDNLFGREDLSDQQLGSSKPASVTEPLVIEALERSPETDVSRIKISINGGHVHLSGVIDDIKETHVLESVAANIRGVTKVTSDFEIPLAKKS